MGAYASVVPGRGGRLGHNNVRISTRGGGGSRHLFPFPFGTCGPSLVKICVPLYGFSTYVLISGLPRGYYAAADLVEASYLQHVISASALPP